MLTLGLIWICISGSTAYDIPRALYPSTCINAEELMYDVICNKACDNMMIPEFGRCGWDVKFTREHFNLQEPAFSLGSIFDVSHLAFLALDRL